MKLAALPERDSTHAKTTQPTLSLARAASSSLRSLFHTRSRVSRSAIILRRFALAPACRAARAALALPQACSDCQSLTLACAGALFNRLTR